MSNSLWAYTLLLTDLGRKFLPKRLRRQWTILGSLSLWLVSGLNSAHAGSKDSLPLATIFSKDILLDQPHSYSVELRDRPSAVPSHAAPFSIAGADNFNPGLQLPPPKPEELQPSSSSGEQPSQNSQKVGLESIQTEFRNDRDSFGQHNRFTEETAQFRLSNGDRLHAKTGLNSFEQSKIEPVQNIPLAAGWEGKLGSFNLRAATGVDLYNRLPATPYLNLEVAAPLLPNVTLTGVVEQGAYKFNAQTLENRISAWRLGSNLYWQIDRQTSLFALYRWGRYSDSNTEQQSFSRLERKFGQFSLAANLFTWSYANNVEKRKGYFSPPDFLTYNGELAWEGNVLQPLRCRLAAVLGRQRINGAFSSGNSYQARCTVKVSPNVEADLGYTLSGIRTRGSSAEGYESQSVTGQLRFKF
jgi:hypothetical protein